LGVRELARHDLWKNDVGIWKIFRCGRGIDEKHLQPDGLADLHERFSRWRGTANEQLGFRQVGLDVNLHGPATVARHTVELDALTYLSVEIGGEHYQPGLAIGKSLLGFLKHGGLRATPPDPAHKLTCARNNRFVPWLARGGSFSADNSRQRKGHALRHQLVGFL
jgi:hypothetical protein